MKKKDRRIGKKHFRKSIIFQDLLIRKQTQLKARNQLLVHKVKI